MFISDETIQTLINKYGQPEIYADKFACEEDEFYRIKSSQKDDRNHDVTLYIKKDDKYLVIAKHFYPPHMYRAPSGGIKPNEDFEQGAKREAFEETGCKIKLTKFLLQTNIVFYLKDNEKEKINWRSFIFEATTTDSEFNFTDTNEIREAKLASLEDFENYSVIMRSLNIAGLKYRAALHDKIKKLLT